MTTGFASRTRWAKAFAANPPNTTVWIAPSRLAASMPIKAAGTMGTLRNKPVVQTEEGLYLLYTSTTSPFFTPSSLKTAAKVSTS